MASRRRRGGWRGLLARAFGEAPERRRRELLFPNLQVLRLEDRRVLSGLSVASLNADHELVVSAGSQANDGQADAYAVSRDGDQVRVSVDGQEVYAGDVDDISKIRVEGSADQDTLTLDFSGGDPLPSGGIEFAAGSSPQGAADSLVLLGGPSAGSIDTVTYEFHGDGAGSIRVSLGGDAAGDFTASVAYSGVESIRDATQADHLVFQTAPGDEVLTLADDAEDGNGVSTILSSNGLQVAFDAPNESLTIETANDDGGADRVNLASLDAQHPVDLVVHGDADDTVTVSGTVDLDGGNLAIAAGAVHVEGTIAGGEVLLDAGPEGTLSVSGTIDVSGLAAGQTGGTVRLLGARVELVGQARIDARGTSGGGTVLVGGGIQGHDPNVSSAVTTYVGPGVVILADAVESGDGGTVVVWADGATVFSGTISAKGGPSGGRGGLAEVSGEQSLVFDGFVDLSAPSAQSGTLLLDPGTIDIDAALAATIVDELSFANVVIEADVINVLAPVDASSAADNNSLTLIAPIITFRDGADLITHDGDLVLQGYVALADGASVLLSTGDVAGGDIIVDGTIDGAHGAGHEGLSLLAGTGTVTVTGAIGGEVALASLTVLQSDDATLGGAVTASTITLVGIAGEVAFQGNVTAATLNTTAEGYSISFLGTSNTLVNGAAFVNAGGVTVGDVGDTTLSSSAGGFRFEGPVILAGNTVAITAAGDVWFHAAVDLNADVTIEATGSITFESTLVSPAADAHSLTLTSDANIDFHSAVGAGPGNALGAIVITTAFDVTALSTIECASLTQLVGFGATTLHGDVTTTAPEGVDLAANQIVLDGLTITAEEEGIVHLDGAVDLTGAVSIKAAGTIAFGGTVVSSGGRAETLTLSSGANVEFHDSVGAGAANRLGAVTIVSAADVTADSTIEAASLVQLAGSGTTTLLGDVTTTAAAGVDLSASLIVLGEVTINTAGGGDVQFRGPVELHGDVSIAATGAIAFEGTAVSPAADAHALTLAADGNIDFRDLVGAGPGNALGPITITTAFDVTALSTIECASLVQLVGFGTTTLYDNVTTTAPEGVDLTANQIVLDGLGPDGLHVVNTDGGLVRFNGPVELRSDVAIDTADGNILFTTAATIDSQLGESNSLTLAAGVGSVSFNANIGDTQPIGSLIVPQADAGVAFGASGGGDFGPVTCVSTDGEIDLGSAAAIVGGIVLDAGDGNTISFITGADRVRLNGPVELRSDALIDTRGAGDDVGAEIRFTANATIDSQAGENNDLILTAGVEGTVTFNANIGEGAALGQLIVTEAQGVVFGNDPSFMDADLGPVTIVRVEGDLDPANPDAFDINLGSVTAIGADAIVLNAGDGNTISFTTTADAVRFNGAVQLQSDALIDTSDAGSQAGAQIRFTLYAPIDSQPGENNDLILTAGVEGTVSFSADIGASDALGQLIVTDARGVAFGNDPSPSDADLGPVATVQVDGDLDPLNPDAFDIDIGSVTAIGADGIALNAGDGNTISLVTTADRVRLNGAVELQSDALIDTSDAGNEVGAEIRFTVYAAIDSQAGENNDLTLTAGTDGTVSFNADIGTIAALGQLIVTDAQGVVFGNEPSFLDADLGPVTTVWVDGDLDPMNADAFDIDIGSVTPIGAGGIVLNAGSGNAISLLTTADAVRLNGAVQLQSDAVIDTSGAGIDMVGADILMDGTVDGTSGGPDENLTLISHSGTTTVTGAVGGGEPLGTIWLQDDQPESTGAVVFLDTVNAASLVTVGQPYQVALLGGGMIEDAVEFLNTGGVTLGDTPDDDLTFGHGVTSTASDTSIGGTVRTLDQDIRLANVLVIADARLITTGGTIHFGGTVDGELGEANDLELTAESGTIEFTADVGADVALDRLVVTTAGTVILGSDATPVKVVKADGGIDLGSDSVIDQGIRLNGGAGGLLTMSTAGGTVRFNGAVELQSDVSINSSDDGEPLGAEIRFTLNSPIDSEPGENNDLTLTAGSDGIVSFNADIGANQALGLLIVTDAGGVTFGNDPSAVDPDLAPVTTVRVVGDPAAADAFAIDIGSVSPIGAGGIALNGGDGNTISFTTTADRVRFNGAVQLQSDVLVDTTDAGNEVGAEIRFSLNAPIDSQAGETNDLTLTAGTDGTVAFNADIGSSGALGQLTVTDAKGVYFGGDDSEEKAPITTVRVDGDPSNPDAFAVNIGSVTPIGDEGIVLNAGNTLSGDPLTLTFTTTGDAVRFNGAVQLKSDAAVDTSGAGSAGGAEIRFTLNSPINSQSGETNDLTLTAGTDGTVSFNADIGAAPGGQLGRLVVTDAQAVWFGNDADAAHPDLHPVSLVNAAGDADPATYDIDIGSASQGTTDAAIGSGGIVLNGGSGTIQLSTAGDGIRLNGAVTLASAAALDTTAGGEPGADILFTVNGTIDSQAGENNPLTLTAGSDGRVSFNGNIGVAHLIGSLTVIQADAGVVFGGDDDATDANDLGPVTVVNTDGAIDLGVGANVVADGIVFNGGPAPLAMTTTGDDVRMNGPVTLNSHLAIDTQSGDCQILFTRAATIDSQGGEQNALSLKAGAHESPGLGAGGVFFYGNVGTGAAGDQRLGQLTVDTAGQIVFDPADANGVVRVVGDMTLDARGDIVIVSHQVAVDSCQVVAGQITANAGGVLTIEDGAVLKSDTGAVTNAGPRLTLDPQDPNDAITPGDPTQTVSGTIGVDGSGNYQSDNLEQGQNFTLIIVWNDTDANGNQIVTTIKGLSAGQHVTGVVVDEYGNVHYSGSDATIDSDGALVFQPKPGSGPITFEVTRFYPLTYLMTVTGDVRAIVILGNDGYSTRITGVIKDMGDVQNAPTVRGRIYLDDSRKANDGSDLDLNRVYDARYKHLAGELFRFAEMPTEFAKLPIPQATEVERPPLEETTPGEAATRAEYSAGQSEEAVESLRSLFIVKVGVDGKEGESHRLPDDALSDLAGLFEKLRQEGLPNGLYRIYLKEVGFPRRKLIEFYKSGKSFGDPVREPGPGANPIQEERPDAVPKRPSDNSAPLPPAAEGQGGRAPAPEVRGAADAWEMPGRTAHPVVGAAVLALAGVRGANVRGRWAQRVQKVMKDSGEKSFSRAARLCRRLRKPGS